MANDVTILAGLILFFLILGVAVPVIQDEFSQDVNNYNPDSLEDFDEPDTGWFGTTFSKILGNVYLVMLWTFGVPAWVNLTILLAMRMILAFLLYRAVRSGGG